MTFVAVTCAALSSRSPLARVVPLVVKHGGLIIIFYFFLRRWLPCTAIQACQRFNASMDLQPRAKRVAGGLLVASAPRHITWRLAGSAKQREGREAAVERGHLASRESLGCAGQGWRVSLPLRQTTKLWPRTLKARPGARSAPARPPSPKRTRTRDPRTRAGVEHFARINKLRATLPAAAPCQAKIRKKEKG